MTNGAVSSWRHSQDRYIQVIKILRCQTYSAKICIRAKRSEITQVPEPISSLTAPSKLVYSADFFLLISKVFNGLAIMVYVHENDSMPGAIIGDGDRKSWDARGPMIWDNFSIFRTNCAILTSCIRADPRTCGELSRGCCHVALSTSESCEILLSIFHSDGKE